MRFVTGPSCAQSVIHLCTMQVVRPCDDDISISNNGALKCLFHVWASFHQYGTGDLTTVPRVFVCRVNDHACLRRLREKKK